MKTKIINHAVIVLLMVVGFFSCSKMNNEFDPYAAILGRWELVGTQRFDGAQEPLKSNGYYEFRPDSVVVWHDYATRHNIVMKYWFESVPIDCYYMQPSYNKWHLHFQSEPNSIPAGINVGGHIDLYVQGWKLISFSSKNQIGLKNAMDLILLPSIYVFRRKR